MAEFLTYAGLADMDYPRKAVHLPMPVQVPVMFAFDVRSAVHFYIDELSLCWREWGLSEYELMAELQAATARLFEAALLMPKFTDDPPCGEFEDRETTQRRARYLERSAEYDALIGDCARRFGVRRMPPPL
jgi:hypothetical protein